MRSSGIRPTLEPRSPLEQSRQLRRSKTMLRLRKAQNPYQERSRLNLRQGQFLTTTKERTLALCVSQKGLDLLRDGSDELLGGGVALGLIGSADTGEEGGEDFADEGVDEEADTGAVEGVFG